MARHVHLVGSVPLANAREVFETVSAALGQRLKRIPDGETGERSDWVSWQEAVFADRPAFENSGQGVPLTPDGDTAHRYRLKPGKSAATVDVRQLFYADIAVGSYRDFAELKRGGNSPRTSVPGRSGAGAFGDLALSRG